MKKIITIALMLFACTIYSQITLIPDPNFEQYLIDTGIDTDGIINGQVFTSDIEDELELNFLGNQITDLTGIEDFTNLEILDIQIMDIEEINLSNNLNLKRLDIEDVSLNSLDISNNIALEEFNLSLNFNGGQYTSSMDSIDLNSNTLLEHLTISRANISFLDFVNNININFLRLSNMENLNNINLKNGNNQNLIWLQIINNENLECVQVDDPEAVIAGTDPPYDNWVIENDPDISDDCYLGIEENLNSIINVYPNPVKDFLTIGNNEFLYVKKITVYDALGNIVLVENNKFNRLNLSYLNSGVYFIKIETENRITTRKILKE